MNVETFKSPTHVGTTFNSQFTFGDHVLIDGGPVTGRVVGFIFYPHDMQVQVSWWNSGALVEQWIGAWRLEIKTE